MGDRPPSGTPTPPRPRFAHSSHSVPNMGLMRPPLDGSSRHSHYAASAMNLPGMQASVSSPAAMGGGGPFRGAALLAAPGSPRRMHAQAVAPGSPGGTVGRREGRERRRASAGGLDDVVQGVAHLHTASHE